MTVDQRYAEAERKLAQERARQAPKRATSLSKDEIAKMFSQVPVATAEQIAEADRREDFVRRQERLTSCGIDITEEERHLVMHDRMTRTVPLSFVRKWHREAPRAGCPVAALEEASRGILVLTGGMGTGKSLAAAWWLSQVSGKYITRVELMTAWETKRNRFRPDEEPFARLLRCDHVALDEFGAETDAEIPIIRDAWFAFVNGRRCKRKRTLVLSNTSLKAFFARHDDTHYSRPTGDRLRMHAECHEVAGKSMRGAR